MYQFIYSILTFSLPRTADLKIILIFLFFNSLISFNAQMINNEKPNILSEEPFFNPVFLIYIAESDEIRVNTSLSILSTVSAKSGLPVLALSSNLNEFGSRSVLTSS